MASPVFTTGDLVSAADWNAGSLGLLGYGETTASVGSITTSAVNLATAAYTAAPDRRIEMTGTWESLTSTVSGDRVRLELVDGVGIRNKQIRYLSAANTGMEGGTIVASFTSGGAGLNTTAVLRAVRHSGTGTVTVTATTDAAIRVFTKDIGSA